jgi:glutaredoxin
VGVVKLAFPFVFSLDKAICNTITFCSSGKKEKKNKLD